MSLQKLRSFFRGRGEVLRRGSEVVSSPALSRPSVPGSLSIHKPSTLAPVSRQSRGLEQFCFNIRDVVGLNILDFSGAHQENIAFLTNCGHRPSCHDMVRSLDEAFGPDPSSQNNPGLIETFLNSNFDYPAAHFDGVLLWDCLQFMGPALLAATVDRLALVMRPGAYVFACFTANERLSEVPSHAFRIVDSHTISITERGMRTSGQILNNRNLEKLFGRFDSVKFFLTRDHLRELIVRR